MNVQPNGSISDPRSQESIVESLKKVLHLEWSEEETFSDLEVIRHPLIAQTAEDPKGIKQRRDALRAHLISTAERLEQQEKEEEPINGRPVAFASKALLRLAPEFEGETLIARREMITDLPWINKKTGKKVTVDGFRLHVEGKVVLEPFAAEFRRYADELAERGFFDPDAEDPGNLDSAEEAIVRRLRVMENVTYNERMGQLETDGALMIRHEVEMVKVLQMITDQAQQEFKAVDGRPPKEWKSSLMKNYLTRQLSRVDEDHLSLERIYLVSEDGMKNATFRKTLAWLVKLHEDASARLLLCPLAAAKDLELSFRPELGLFLADGAGKEPLGVTGMLNNRSVGHAVVYTRDSVNLRRFINEYKMLADEIDGNDFDGILREQLPELAQAS